MLDPRESARLYEEIGGTLRDLDLGWVVDQVNQRIAAGKTVKTKEVRPYAEVLRPRKSQTDVFGGETIQLDRQLVESKATTFFATEEFNTTERLSLLLDAIERVVIDTYQTEQALPEMLSPQESKEIESRAIDQEELIESVPLFAPESRGAVKPDRVQFASEVGDTDPLQVVQSSDLVRDAAVLNLASLIAQLREEIRA